MTEAIIPGIVESRRKKFTESEKNSSNRDGISKTDTSLLSLNWHMRQQDSDLAHIKNELIIKGKIIDDLQVKLNLLQTLTANLYEEKEELLSDIKEVRKELNLLKHRECVLHSDSIASIWKPSSSST